MFDSDRNTGNAPNSSLGALSVDRFALSLPSHDFLALRNRITAKISGAKSLIGLTLASHGVCVGLHERDGAKENGKTEGHHPTGTLRLNDVLCGA